MTGVQCGLEAQTVLKPVKTEFSALFERCREFAEDLAGVGHDFNGLITARA